MLRRFLKASTLELPVRERRGRDRLPAVSWSAREDALSAVLWEVALLLVHRHFPPEAVPYGIKPGTCVKEVEGDLQIISRLCIAWLGLVRKLGPSDKGKTIDLFPRRNLSTAFAPIYV
jgi:hypothetical protein